MKTHIFSCCTVLFLISWAISSCNSGEDPPVQTYPPGIVIYDPDEGSTIQGPLEISADILYDDLKLIVSEVSVKVTRDSDNAILFEEGPIPNNTNFYSYYHIFTPSGLASPTSLTLVINGKGSGQVATKSVKFTVEP